MKKNQSNLYPFALQDQLKNGMTGQTPSVYIRKDLGSFALATNSATEFDAQNSPGLYDITFTAAECNCDVLTIQVTLPNGQEPAILDVVEMEGASSSLTAAEVWQYNGQEGRTVTNTIPSVSDIQSGLATSDALSAVASNVSAVKAKTDNIPQSPAAVGSAMTLTSETVTSIKNGLATSDGLSSLASHGDNYWVTADVSGLATGGGLEALATYGDSHWATADVSEIPTAEENAAAVWDAETRTITDSPDIQAELTTYGAAKTSDIPTAQDIWEYSDRELTSEISVDISAQNIKDITDSVWDADDRTLTDLTPKPNMKNIACTPSNVINSYGIPRLENWTNETAGTQAFDDKINTYITLAKEKMATDLNNHINAAIAYIGADNITELCAWLTGYNLYQDDESTDTDSLPETRYNQYLEQIHRIMENI